jgi:hypothetical protein
MEPDVEAAIKEIRIVTKTVIYNEAGTETTTVEVLSMKFWDKVSALRQLAEHLGLVRGLTSINVLNIDWASLFRKLSQPDPIEDKIAAIEHGRTSDGRTVNGQPHGSGE